MKFYQHALRGILSFCLVLLICSMAFAAYPTKPITVMQGFKPGGGSDALAQLTQPYLEKILGKSFVNQYIPGATGGIAWMQLANTAKKDGYTLAIFNTPMLQTNYIMNPGVKYTLDDIEPLVNITTDPGIIIVAKDSPYKTAKDFFAAIKKNPGKMTIGNSGVWGDDFFAILVFEKVSGFKVQIVPFEGEGPSCQAAMGGKVDASFSNLGINYPQLKAGNLRALAIMSDKRYPGLPNVPTFKELGYNVISGSSRGYCAPKGISSEVKKTLIEAFKKMEKNPAFVKGCNDRATILDFRYGDDCRKTLEKEADQFRGIWKEVKDQYQKK